MTMPPTERVLFGVRVHEAVCLNGTVEGEGVRTRLGASVTSRDYLDLEGIPNRTRSTSAGGVDVSLLYPLLAVISPCPHRLRAA